jgi:D-alanyl-D-alanine carboxypeptidase
VPIFPRWIVSQSFTALALALSLAAPTKPLHAEALLVIEADSGKVIFGENATYPWYPASVTKLMTTYVTLKAIRDHRVTPDTLFAYSANAAAQQPSKMGFRLGVQLTVDNALKMLLVHSANDMAVVLAEGVSGSIEKFSDEMNATARRLGMTQTSYVNPNGLPADEQITSARDLAILARALIRDFPEYDNYWHIASIRLGKRIYHNTNRMIDAYPGTDGMKTGFICASGFNLVATATHNGKRLIAVVLGAHSSHARTVKAAELLERGFSGNALSWLIPANAVEQLVPIAAAPPNLREEICGKNHSRAAEEEANEQAGAGDNGLRNFLLSSVNAPRGAALLTSGLAAAIPPVEVYVGPARQPGAVVINEPDPFPPTRTKKKSAAVAAKPDKPAVKPAAVKPSKGGPKPAAGAVPADAASPTTAALKPWPGDSVTAPNTSPKRQ